MSQGIKRKAEEGVSTPSAALTPGITPGNLSVTESAGKGIGTRRESGDIQIDICDMNVDSNGCFRNGNQETKLA